ncbi:hypothetical protein [Streptomyces sp. NPDC058867]|uniref:hypothetical protein n=1 Tax=Streptomyces sp. NPDC058867 TaxID=3346657 RepID=UPI0036744457
MPWQEATRRFPFLLGPELELVTDLYEAGLLSVEGPSSVGTWLSLEAREAPIGLRGPATPAGRPVTSSTGARQA